MNWKPPEGEPIPAKAAEGSGDLLDRYKWWISGALLVVLVVFATALRSNSDGGNDEPSIDEQRYSVHAACAEFTRDRLKAPASADFPEYDDRGVLITSSGNRWVVESFVDSDNSFGANIRTSFRCVALDRGDTWRPESWTEG